VANTTQRKTIQNTGMTASTQLQGRTGNNFYQIAMLIAYAKRHGMDYHVPEISPHCPGKKLQFNIAGSSPALDGYAIIFEPAKEGKAFYEPQQFRVNPQFRGYWQSFKYFDDYRQDVLDAFNLPYKFTQDVVSIHVRRGDFLTLDAFKPMPLTYYQNCVQYFRAKDYRFYYVFSDDIPWCKEHFNAENFPNCYFSFIENGTEIGDFTYMSCCEHNICANSSFSFAAAWLNQNKDKIVLCPDETYCWFNTDYIPDYFTKIN
jgi:hypothetical protein